MLALRRRFVSLGVVGAFLFGLGIQSASALTFNLTFDSSTSTAPAAFFTAVQAAANFYESNYSDPITINIQVGWGSIDGGSLAHGDLGQSSTNQVFFFNYAQIKNDLVKDAKSPDDATAIAHLPATDPTSGASFVMSYAEAKALGILAGNDTALDGWVGFDSAASYAFNPNNRAVAGEYDFVGLAEHEISEVMGRYGLGQNGTSSGRYSPIDLFRFTSPGVFDLVPENGDYFSIDGGVTNLNTYNGTGAGDLSDWSGLTHDSFNAFLSSGVELPVSPTDLTLMDVIGYDRVLPEPTAWTVLGFGMVMRLGLRRRGNVR